MWLHFQGGAEEGGPREAKGRAVEFPVSWVFLHQPLLLVAWVGLQYPEVNSPAQKGSKSPKKSRNSAMMMMWSIFNTILRPLCGFPPLQFFLIIKNDDDDDDLGSIRPTPQSRFSAQNVCLMFLLLRMYVFGQNDVRFVDPSYSHFSVISISDFGGNPVMLKTDFF
jgi:hypothetical protein